MELSYGFDHGSLIATLASKQLNRSCKLTLHSKSPLVRLGLAVRSLFPRAPGSKILIPVPGLMLAKQRRVCIVYDSQDVNWKSTWMVTHRHCWTCKTTSKISEFFQQGGHENASRCSQLLAKMKTRFYFICAMTNRKCKMLTSSTDRDLWKFKDAIMLPAGQSVDCGSQIYWQCQWRETQPWPMQSEESALGLSSTEGHGEE